MTTTARSLLVLFACTVLGSGAALAERADREKPVHLEASRVTVDDVKRVHVFEGNVVLTQGTLVIRTAKLVVTQDAEGFQKGVATGGSNGLARFRQKREGKDEYVDGESERIEYDSRAEKAEFFTRAYIKSGVDEVRGHYISYDGKTEQYLVTAVPGASQSSEQGRVTAIIQPKNAKTGAAPSTPR
ncbi:MAG: lipopolysaccharide transport periplasmic protein LptA [Gammaproteobacteria bacterium]|nr:lipopolysaccharide transport periplasmic protein LptA [Rhodocyclaceae bacterium]MBU3909456.1 lipopolysaccharide transport periplasmic protein LptA [Gammaproteobacteria bacterium]MBU3988284.1 lipopolysaccharide transport periplasmic protein LptA [Gammaproteobacteria bacterium]MBU4003634.1 lipopolysaccharide transport periplasmic protein LptA [Gammaproteobacteria bacterium]MBU4021992.1 lipopolysaccharide transport periplasmic protein LptA [Gammaproteobacteria bacterium]